MTIAIGSAIALLSVVGIYYIYFALSSNKEKQDKS